MYDRNIRVSQLLKQEISSMILFGEIKDPRIQNVFITNVEVSKDLSNAKIYFKIMENSNYDFKEIERVFNRAGNFIRNTLFRRLSLKKPINLKFFYDNSDEYAKKIDQIIEKIHGK